MKTIYKGDSRYEKIYEQMQLLDIQDVTSPTQVKNGTIVWRLPMKGRGNTHIEYASFATGYVRNQGNQCHSNWQINKRVNDEPRYFELPNGDYRKYVGKVCKMIPIEIDRLEYMMKYVIKNDFIKRANMLHTDFVPKWKYDMQKENLEFHEARANEYRNNINDVTVIIDGHKYKLI
tara:strand:- start:90 stop:617 length:528 start_codon:yes stop_codon:yes gene_type:complete